MEPETTPEKPGSTPAHPCAPCIYAATTDDLERFGVTGPRCRVGTGLALALALAPEDGRCAHFVAANAGT